MYFALFLTILNDNLRHQEMNLLLHYFVFNILIFSRILMFDCTNDQIEYNFSKILKSRITIIHNKIYL